MLNCGNHFCTRPCHVVTRRRAVRDGKVELVNDAGEVIEHNHAEGSGKTGCDTQNNAQRNEWELEDLEDQCETCDRGCNKERNPPCKHHCPLPCHLGRFF